MRTTIRIFRKQITNLTDIKSGLLNRENVEFNEDVFELTAPDVLVHEEKVILVFGDLVERHDEGEVWLEVPM